MAVQHRVGVLPEQRAWVGSDCPGCLATHGKDLADLRDFPTPQQTAMRIESAVCGLPASKADLESLFSSEAVSPKKVENKSHA
jgi:hypothetical protein